VSWQQQVPQEGQVKVHHGPAWCTVASCVQRLLVMAQVSVSPWQLLLLLLLLLLLVVGAQRHAVTYGRPLVQQPGVLRVHES